MKPSLDSQAYGNRLKFPKINFMDFDTSHIL